MYVYYLLIAFYWIGYALAWYRLRNSLRKFSKNDYGWSEVFLALFTALFSWVVLFVMSINKSPKIKPPKFL